MSKRFTYNEVKEMVEKEGYKLLSTEYHRNSEKLLYECEKGHKYTAKFNDFRSGHRCPCCSGRARHTYKEIKELIEMEGYTLLEKQYTNAHTPMKMICSKGHECIISWCNFKNNFRCKRCGQSISKGEREILKYLESKNIEFKHQKIFKDLSYTKYLIFDFYIPSLNLCIEYDGEQHFKPVKFGNQTQEQMNKEFENTKIRDKMKDDYCKKNNINLLRIPYTEFKNINNILDKVL